MSALLIIDVQNDFCERGSLEVSNANEIISLLNALKESDKFSHVFLSQDWHPENHISFQVNNPGSELFKEKLIEETGILQMMWPVHCVQNTPGAEFHPGLNIKDTDIIIRKGQNPQYDSYSAFGCVQDRTTLLDELWAKGIEKVYITGLAFDYCVGYTAIDAANYGFEVHVISEATRAVAPETAEKARKIFQEKNITISRLSEFLDN
ncbi:unnamed protein product [Blepharisma stoltei]|uniref:nicotinamidase n=1 Tax=Blepharisma stoltei TaxID=1481888 RepID=A0AAU9IHX9_9CILI|nr:unnamed protein product [Blepharisma stoltei]